MGSRETSSQIKNYILWLPTELVYFFVTQTPSQSACETGSRMYRILSYDVDASEVLDECKACKCELWIMAFVQTWALLLSKIYVNPVWVCQAMGYSWISFSLCCTMMLDVSVIDEDCDIIWKTLASPDERLNNISHFSNWKLRRL